MSQHESVGMENDPLENFLLGGKEYMSSCKNTDSMDAENSQELDEMKQGGHQMNPNALTQFRSSSTLTVCPSPQLVPSPHSGSRSVPPYFPNYASPSPMYPTSPATASPTCHPVLGSSSTSQFHQTPNKMSPRRVRSDSESSHRSGISKQGHFKNHMFLQRSLSSTPTKAMAARLNSTFSILNRNSLVRRKLTTQTSQPGLTESFNRTRSTSLSPYSIEPMDINDNLVPENVHFITNQNQTAQSHFLSNSPSAELNLKSEQQCSQESLPAHVSPHNMLSNVKMSPGAVLTAQPDSNISGSSEQQHTVSRVSVDAQSPTLLADHSPGNGQSPRATQIVEQDYESLNCQSPCDNSKPQNEVPQAIPVSFAQSYTNLTPWTTRLVNSNQNSVPNINDETLPLTLGINDSLLLSASAKENQPQLQETYGMLNQPYSCIQQPATESDDLTSKTTKDTYKIMPNKQLRFRKTADALQKSGLWEVAMKTGSLIRRNKELQKELDKFRADALIFLKSVIKNPHNWKLIKSILSNALSSNQASSKASPIMTVVVSAAEAAAAASVKLDSAGSTDGSTSSSSSMCGNASDSSGHSSNDSSETAFVDNHFASTKHGFSCVGMAMDVN